MNSTVKSVLFWFAVIVAAFAIYQYSRFQGESSSPPQQVQAGIEGEWLLAGDPKLACAIFRQGSTLLIVNERGDLATALLEGETRIVNTKGSGWETGLTAEFRAGGKAIAWRDGTVWTRR